MGNPIINLLTADGKSTACSAGVFSYARTGSPYDRAAPQSFVFGVEHKWFANRKNPRSTEEADYHQWRDHLERILQITVLPNGYWQTPEWSYGQLVFAVTLLRQPLEYYKTYPFCFKYMMENKIDPMATIVGMAWRAGGSGSPENYRNDGGWFYNSYGHGLAYITDILRAKLPPADGVPIGVPIEKLRRLDAVKCMAEMKGCASGAGSYWQRGQTVGQLDAPREYAVGEHFHLPIIPDEPKPVAKPPAKVPNEVDMLHRDLDRYEQHLKKKRAIREKLKAHAAKMPRDAKGRFKEDRLGKALNALRADLRQGNANYAAKEHNAVADLVYRVYDGWDPNYGHYERGEV